MPTVNDSSVPIRSVEDGGYLPVVHDLGTATPTLRLLPVAEIETGLSPSETATQPEDLGTVAPTISVIYQSADEALAEFADIHNRLDALVLVYGDE